MVHTYTVKNSRRYRYYVCLAAQQKGYDACPSKALSAQAVEDSIVDRLRGLGADPRIAEATVRKVREETSSRTEETKAELRVADKELGRLQRELVKVVATPGNGTRTGRLADPQDQIRVAATRNYEMRSELEGLAAGAVDEDDLGRALQEFDALWQSLNTGVQTRLIRAIIDRVGYDGRTGKIAVTFRVAGFRAICDVAQEASK